MRKIRIKIFHKRWVVRFLKYKKFKKKHTNKVLGITHRQKKRIDLCLKYCDLETVTHELVHAHLEEMCLTPADIPSSELEEIFCDFLIKHGERVRKLGKQVFNEYLKLKNKRVK